MYKKLFLSFVFTTLMLCQPAVAQTPPPLIDARTLSHIGGSIECLRFYEMS